MGADAKSQMRGEVWHFGCILHPPSNSPPGFMTRKGRVCMESSSHARNIAAESPLLLLGKYCLHAQNCTSGTSFVFAAYMYEYAAENLGIVASMVFPKVALKRTRNVVHGSGSMCDFMSFLCTILPYIYGIPQGNLSFRSCLLYVLYSYLRKKYPSLLRPNKAGGTVI